MITKDRLHDERHPNFVLAVDHELFSGFISYLAGENWTGHEISWVVEKPWNYTEEFLEWRIEEERKDGYIE